MNNPEEEEILVKSAQSNPENFKEIYIKFSNEINRYVYSILMNKEAAEDITSQAFAQAFENLDKFKWSGISIKYWLISIARNLSFNRLKKDRKLAQNSSNELELEVGGYHTPTENLDLTLLMEQYLKSLPTNIREIVVLKVWDEYTFSEIAELVGIPENSIKTQFYRALEKIKEDLERDNRKVGIPMILLSIEKSKNAFETHSILKVSDGTNVNNLINTNLSKRIFMNKTFAAVLCATLFLFATTLGGTLFYLYRSEESEKTGLRSENNETKSETDQNNNREGNQESEPKNIDETDSIPVETETGMYSYSIDLTIYDVGKAKRKATITFESSRDDLKVTEVGVYNQNMVMPEVAFTKIKSKDTEIKFAQYYESFSQNYKSIVTVGTNPIITGSIGRHTENSKNPGYVTYVSDFRLDKECMGLGESILPPCGGEVLKLGQENSLFMFCKDDLNNVLCDEIVLNIKEVTFTQL